MEITPYTKVYRLMHWAMAIAFVLILFTIFLRLTWLNKNNVSSIIQNYLATTNQSLNTEQSILLAKKIRQPMWNWHIYLGYVLTGLFSLRLILPLFKRMQFQNPLTKGLPLKMKFQKWIYIVFYICVAVSLFTGLVIEWGPKRFKSAMETVHVLSIYYLVAFIILHLAGVLFAEFTTQKGIISRIVSGSGYSDKNA